MEGTFTEQSPTGEMTNNISVKEVTAKATQMRTHNHPLLAHITEMVTRITPGYRIFPLSTPLSGTYRSLVAEAFDVTLLKL